MHCDGLGVEIETQRSINGAVAAGGGTAAGIAWPGSGAGRQWQDKAGQGATRAMGGRMDG